MDHELFERISELQSYIEENIGRPITLLELARKIHYSPWHVDRLFQKMLSKTPMQYIKERRLSLAALSLRDQQAKVMDVALEFVFDSHEGFTRAFTKHFGISPYRYKKEYPPIPLFMPHPVVHPSTFAKKGGIMQTKALPVFVQIIERPRRKLIVRRGVHATHYFAYCEEVGCDVWGVLTSVKEALYEPIGLWLPDVLRLPSTSTYVQGVEVDMSYDKPLPEGFEMMVLEPFQFMVFQGPKYRDEDFMEAIEAFSEAIKDFDPTVYGYAFACDEQPEFQLEPRGERGYIEAKPVRKIG